MAHCTLWNGSTWVPRLSQLSLVPATTNQSDAAATAIWEKVTDDESIAATTTGIRNVRGYDMVKPFDGRKRN